MASVWYLGRSNKRIITAQDWAKAGIAGASDTVWDKSNGYSVPASSLNAQQLALLAPAPEFNTTAPDGPRVSPSSDVPPDPLPQYVLDNQLDQQIADVLGKSGGIAAGRVRSLAAARAGRTNTVVLFGTSLEAQNGTGADTVDPGFVVNALSSRGWFHWCNLFLGNRLKLVRNAGVGGNRYDQMLARIQTDVLAYDSDWVFLGGPVNDISGGRTTAQITADLTTMLDSLADRNVLILTAGPSTYYDTAAEKQTLAEVNDFIRDLRSTRRNVWVADAWRAVADPATGSPATGMAVNEPDSGRIHWSEAGARYVGLAASQVLDAFIPARPTRPANATDPKCVIANPTFATNGFGWATVDTGVVATYPAVEAGQGFGSRAHLSLSGIANTAERGIQSVEPVANGRYKAGDVVQISARVKWASVVPLGVAGPCRPYIRIRPRLADNSFSQDAGSLQCASADNLVITAMPDGSGVVQSNRITLPATVANLYVMLGWQGAASGEIDYWDVNVRKI